MLGDTINVDFINKNFSFLEHIFISRTPEQKQSWTKTNFSSLNKHLWIVQLDANRRCIRWFRTCNFFIWCGGIHTFIRLLFFLSSSLFSYLEFFSDLYYIFFLLSNSFFFLDCIFSCSFQGPNYAFRVCPFSVFLYENSFQQIHMYIVHKIKTK